jgi:hypothetical protein
MYHIFQAPHGDTLMPSSYLPDAKVFRGGVTARRLILEATAAQVSTSKPGSGVRNSFTLSSKGGGTIQVLFDYGSESYEAQIRAMVHNDRNAALAIMGKILAEELSESARREAAVIHGARRQLIDLADIEKMEAEGTDGAIATIVSEKIRDLVRKVDNFETNPRNAPKPAPGSPLA